MTSEGKLMREQHRPTIDSQSRPRFGNYELVRRIDVGGMGEVYLARQRTAFDREVAIKIIRSDLVHDLTARTRFLREAEVSSHLKHEHILPLFEFGEEQGRLFLVTPYIEGGTLARRLTSGPLSLAEVHQLFAALVQAVAYIHRRGVIHRDLKPSNILLDHEDGQLYVRLIDFGIATLQGRAASPPLTTAGTEMGTIAYMAPERLSGIAAPSNDIYSLGIILYQMLTGHLPKIEEHTRLPQQLEYIVHRCIVPRPEDRFANADELLKAFERAYQSLASLPKSPVAPSIPPASPVSPVSPAHSSDANANHTPSNIRENTPPRPPQTTSPDGNAGNTSAPQEEHVVLQNSGAIPLATFATQPRPPRAASPQPQSTFGQEDYSAPTTSIGSSSPGALVSRESGKQRAVAAPPVATPPRPRRRRKRSLMAITSLMILIVLAVIGGLVFYEFQAVSISSVTVSFGPQTHLINKIFQITAKPSVTAVTASTASIPAKVLSTSKSSSQTGQTTGQQCVLGIFDCQQTVDVSDVSNLAAQIRPTLTYQITSDLQRQVQSNGAHAVGSIHFADLSESAEPQVGAVSKTVTVTLKVQGSVEYVVSADSQSLARLLLVKQVQGLGANYHLLSSTIRIGQPVIESVDEVTGEVAIKIAAGVVAQYQFTTTQLQVINNNLKGKSIKSAQAYLQQQPGVDATTISIHFTQGARNTLPDDVKHIKIVPLNPAALPVVELQSVPAPVTSPSQ